MHTGLDIGYNATKAVTDARRVNFASVVGTPDQARFSLNGHEEFLITVGRKSYQIGQAAVRQSRFIARREDRAWIESDEYYNLFLAALTELTPAHWADLVIVTGLPVAFFDDKDRLKAKLMGEHHVQRQGRNAQTFKVTDVKVIPQPFGALLSEVLNNRGEIVNQDLTGQVGVIDIGGKTTNILSVNHLDEVVKETTSVTLGAWDIVRQVREFLTKRCPDLDRRDHQLVDAIKTKKITYYGQPVNLEPALDDILEPMAQQIISQASQLWNGAAALDAVLVAGGGAHLLGSYLTRHYPHARIVENPTFANAVGYWKLSQRLK